MLLRIVAVLSLAVTVLSGQDFSVEAIVNDLHVEPDTVRHGTDKWSRIWKWANSQLKQKEVELRKRDQYGNQEISIQIPDSLADSFFRIKRGEVVTQIFDGTITGKDTITGFEILSSPGWQSEFYFRLAHLESYHTIPPSFRENKYFYVIGDFDVKPISVSFHFDEKAHLLLNRMADALTQKLESSRKFNYYMMRFPHIDTTDSLKFSLLKYCDFSRFSTDIDGDAKPDTIIQVKYKRGVRPPAPGWYFTALILSSTESLYLLPFSYFDSITEVNSQKYLIFRIEGAETGARILHLVTFDKEKGQIVWVFGEPHWTT